MIGAPNMDGQKYLVGVRKGVPGIPVSEEIVDIFRT